MKKIFALISIAAAFAAVSCQKNENAPESAPAKKTVTLTCVIPESSDSKVAIDNQGKTQWEVGDEILIHGKWAGGEYSTTATLTSSDISSDGKTATFTIDAFTDGGYTRGKTTYFASYPASQVAVDNGASSWYSYTYYKTSNAPLMGGCNNVDVDGGNTIYFYNLCGIITFVVDGEFDSYEFVGNNGETVGYNNYCTNLYIKDDGTLNEGFVYSSKVTPLTVITGDVVPDASTLNYICVPGGVNLTDGFTIKFYDGVDLVKVAKSVKGVNLARNSYLPLGNITSHLKDYVAPTSSDHKSEIPTGSATNLAASEPANCYVISSPGTYSFPAVQGNSTTPAGEVFDVELLWETYNNAEAVTANSVIAKVDFEDNVIYFQTPSALKPGNALIAAKGSNGKILWSWHIWIPDGALSVGHYFLFSSGDMMDRNLGALVAASTTSVPIESVGMGYEWGRKDPFPGPSAFGADYDNSSVPGATVSGTINVVHEATSITVATQNPSTIYNVNNGDWNTAPSDELWLSSGAKTIYDPCPAGYKVPSTNDLTELDSSDLSTKTGWATDLDKHYFTIGDPVAVFPLGGYIDDYSTSFKYAYTGWRTVLWFCNSGYGLDVRVNADGTLSRAKKTSPNRSRVGYVRCIVD